MIRVYAYQCEHCEAVFADEKKAAKCISACYKKQQRKKKSKAYQDKLKKQADWFRLNLSSIDDIPSMIERFYKRFHKKKISISMERTPRIEKNLIIFSVKGSSLDGKDVSYDPLTSGHNFGYEARDGGPIMRGMDINGGASGHGNGFHAGLKLDINECPKLKALFDERESLKQKAEEYSSVMANIRSRVDAMIREDELYNSHLDRKKVFASYSYLADKLANERRAKLHNEYYPEMQNKLLTDELKEKYVRFSHLSSVFGVDNV